MHGDMHEKVAEAQRLATEVTAEAVSEDGAVRVVAGPGGDVREIDLRMGAFELSGVELGELTAATVKTAAVAADAALAAAIRASLSDMFAAEREDGR